MDSLAYWKLALIACFTLGVLLLLGKIALQLFRGAKESAAERKVAIEWYTYIDITVICLCVTALALWFKVFIATK